MKNKELIEELQKYDGNKKVYFDDEGWGMRLVTEIDTTPIGNDDILLKN